MIKRHNDFFNSIKDEFPSLTHDQIIDIIEKGVFYQAKKTIESGTLETIRIKYLGKLTVFPGRVAGLKRVYTHQNRSKKISPKRYEELLNIIANYELQQK